MQAKPLYAEEKQNLKRSYNMKFCEKSIPAFIITYTKSLYLNVFSCVIKMDICTSKLLFAIPVLFEDVFLLKLFH